VVIAALAGPIREPRPAVVVQNDAVTGPETILVCPLTSVERDAEAFRLTVLPAPENGLRVASQIMIDKVGPARHGNVRQHIGRLAPEIMEELDRRLAFVLGLGV